MSTLAYVAMSLAICAIVTWLLLWPAHWFLWERRGDDGVTPVERWAIRGAYRKVYGREPSSDELLSKAIEVRSERAARDRYMERMGRNRSREERLADLRDNAVNAPTIERGDGK